WLSPDGKKLYFSSRGHSTMGGFDIFVSILDSASNKWKKPINMGYPLNSARDDIYLMWSLDGNTGYFTSWREDSYGEKDIYKVVKEIPEPSQFALKGRVLDAGTQRPVAATLTFTEPNSQKLIASVNTDPKTGKYSIIVPAQNFDVDVTSKNHIFYEDTVQIPATHAYNERIKDFYLEEILMAHKAILKNIFFDYGQSNLRPESEKELLKLYKLLNDNESLKLEISGHTDSIANHEYNMNLSKERAQAVVDFLLKKGIDPTRLTAMGYGETQPIASNGTDQGRQMNRRTEFLITDIKTDHKLTSINDSLLAVKGMHSNDKNFISKINPIALFDTKPISGQLLPSEVHFPFNEGKVITDYSKRKLDKVVDLMYSYPEIKLQVQAYSDATESASNPNITENRVKTVIEYILEKGITSDRLLKSSVKGTKSNNKSTESDVKNRRVEFLVL
ncbi:MAG: OmpA family protein, partial [Cytophagales bacterium]|nr:OmpA family protein [Cytophagales bacterium]